MMNCDRGFLHNFRVWTVPRYLLRIRGELAIGAHLRATHLYTVGPLGSLTMMQSCASAAKLRAAGPFSQSASGAMFEYGVPPPRIVNSAVRRKASASTDQVKGDALPGPSACRTQDDALQCLPSGDKAPERDDQFACQRDDHGLARAFTAISGAGAIPHCQRALLLKHQKAPGELDHAAPDPGVAGSGEPLFASLRAALIRRAC